MNSLEIKAAAKINLSLSVTGIREDGYHNIDTVMQSVSLYDTLTVSRADKITVECGEMSGERNIAFKAAKLFFEHTGICGGAFIKIEKNIPDGAGLGGGSADAAAVLAGLDRIYNTGLSYETLSGLAARLGADVPFMLRGGTARATGIGEVLEPLPALRDCFIIIAKSEQKPSTGEMYSALDRTEYPQPDISETVSALESGSISRLSGTLRNSFSVLWKDSPLQRILEGTEAAAVSLSGSGPARFAVYQSRATAESAEKVLKNKNIECFLCRPAEKSLVIE